MASKTRQNSAHNATAERLRAIHELQSELTSSPYSHDILELALATATSFQLSHASGYPPAWLLIVGAPSSDKTNTIVALRKASCMLFLDSLTENGIASGFVDEKGKSKRHDMLSRIKTGCVVFKDLTTLFSMRQDKINKILGDLQSVSDGEYSKVSGAGAGVEWTGHVTVLGCITPSAYSEHQRYLAKIGSRFLCYNVPRQTDAQHREGFQRQRERKGNPVVMAQIGKFRDLVHQQISDILGANMKVKPTTDERTRILEDLACFLAKARGADRWVKVDFNDYELTSIQVEEPYRIYAQVSILADALARVHARVEVTDHELDLVRRVVFSTIPENRAKVLQALATAGELTKEGLQSLTKMSEAVVRSTIKELEWLELVRRRPGESTGGRAASLFGLETAIAELIPAGEADHLADLSSP